MKSNITICSIILLVIICAAKSYGQQPDSIRRKSAKYMSVYLKTDTVKAQQVNDILEVYKNGLKRVIVDSSLSREQKRSAAQKLTDEKNAKLELLLPAAELDKLIPTTERRRSLAKRDTTATKQ